jgi:hypothetical protein
MDREELVQLIEGQGRAGGLALDTALVENAVDLAGPLVWNAFAWQFRRKEATLTLTSGQEYTILPSDFGAFLSIRYRNGTSDGWKLRYFAEDSYELFYPNPSVVANDEPRSVKVVHNQGTGRWRAYFTPIPNSNYSTTLIYSIAWGDYSRFKEGFEKLLMLGAWLFIHVPGTALWWGADRAYKTGRRDIIAEVDPAHRAIVTQIRVPGRFRVHDGMGSDRDPADVFRYDWRDY